MHPEFHKAWLLISVSLGCWTLLTLLLSRRGERQMRLTIAAFVALLLLPPLQAYVALARGGVPVFWLQMLSFRLTWAYGPLLMLCVQQALLLPTPPRAQLAAHAAPFVLVGVVLTVLGDAAVMASPLWVWVLLLQVLAYAVYACVLLQRHRARLLQLAQRHRNTSYYWLLFLALGLMAATGFDLWANACVQLGRFPPLAVLQVAALSLALYVNLIAFFAVYQPEIFIPNGLPAAEPPADDVASADPKPTVVRVVELSPSVASALAERLQTLVREQQPHHDDTLSLAKLAAMLDVTPHQLSELLNLHLNSSFYDYLNDLRFQDALALMAQDDEQQILTVADIAYRAGFNNRNSFYKVFKEKTGVTPAQYRKSWAKKA